MIQLIDLCSIQWPLDAHKVLASGVEGIYAQSSRYSTTEDPKFHQIVGAFREAGLVACGAYHFCSQRSDPVAQANFFFQASDGLGQQPGELPPIADFEFCKPDLTCALCVRWLEAFMKRCTELWYPDNYKALMPDATEQDKFMVRMPGVYTYPWYASSHQPELGNSKELAKYWLHLAAYKTRNGKLCPWLPDDGSGPLTALNTRTPKPWEKPLMWQYSGNNGIKTPGIATDCDRDAFLGSSADWDKFRGIWKPVDIISEACEPY